MNGHAPTRGLEFFFLFCKFILECGTFWGDDFLIEFTIGHKHTLTIHFQDKRSICKSPDGWSVEDSISVRIINKKIKKRLSDSLDGAILFLCVSTGLFFYCTFLSFFPFLITFECWWFFFSLCFSKLFCFSCLDFSLPHSRVREYKKKEAGKIKLTTWTQLHKTRKSESGLVYINFKKRMGFQNGNNNVNPILRKRCLI